MEKALFFHLPRHHRDALGRGREQCQQEVHAALLRFQSGPSPAAAAMQSSAKAGQASHMYLSSYCTDSRDSMSPFCSLSSSGRSCSTPRSDPAPLSTSPFPRDDSSRRLAMSVRVSTVLPSRSLLYPLTFPFLSTMGMGSPDSLPTGTE